jgi:hypothetical protein
MRFRSTHWADNSRLKVSGITIDPSSAAKLSGLMAVDPNEDVFILTGINMGPTIVDLEILDAAPTDDGETWDDVVEVTVRCLPGTQLQIHGEMQLPDPEAPNLCPPGSTFARIRVSARGRDADFDLAVTDAREHYLIQTWGAPTPDEPVQTNFTSDAATRWRLARQTAHHFQAWVETTPQRADEPPA